MSRNRSCAVLGLTLLFCLGAPEASHHSPYLLPGINRIDWAADIFSIGSVTSEVAVWMAGGKEARQRYFEARRDATKEISTFQGSGYEGCFHNGVERLQEVDRMHAEARVVLPGWDKITPRVLDLLEESMLLADSAKRWAAKRVLNQFNLDYESAEKEMLETTPPLSPDPRAFVGTPDPPTGSYESMASPPSSDDRTRPQSTDTAPTDITADSPGVLRGSVGDSACCGQPDRPATQLGPCPLIEAANDARLQLQERTEDAIEQNAAPGRVGPLSESVGSSRRASISRLPVPEPDRDARGKHSLSSSGSSRHVMLEDLCNYRANKKAKHETQTTMAEAIDRVKMYIQGRDHFFLIDDSETMSAHKPEVERALQAMSYLAKEVDTNGIEMAFASTLSRKVYRSRKTRKLVQKLHNHVFRSPPDAMEDKMGRFVDLLQKRFSSSVKKISILFFTDGCWGDDGHAAAGVQDPIKTLINFLLDRGINRTTVMISIVRFGNAKGGKQNLAYLDDFGKSAVFRDSSGSPTA